MKAFLWSCSLHVLLLGLLAYHQFTPSEAAKVKPEPPILAYAYQPVKTKAMITPPAVVQATKPVDHIKKPKQTAKKVTNQAKPKKTTSVAKTAKPKAVAVKTAAKPFVPVRKPAMVKPLPKSTAVAAKPAATAAVKPVPEPKPAVVAAEVKPLPEPKPAVVVAAVKPVPVPKPAAVVATVKPVPVPKPAAVTAAAKAAPEPQPIAAEVKPDRQAATLPTTHAQSAAKGPASTMAVKQSKVAEQGLQAAKVGDASGSASWKARQQELALEITQVKAKDKPQAGRRVKTFSDGSSLIDTNPGCWKVPPPDSGQNAIWLKTGVLCKPDTTAEQINDILKKRRTYGSD